MDPALHELGFGEWEGKSWSSLEAEDGVRLSEWMADWISRAPPGGESALDLERRVRKWHSNLDPERVHLLVSHAGVVRALRVVVRGVDWKTAMLEPVPYQVPEAL
jgi:alpha-ribazole phosphatase